MIKIKIKNINFPFFHHVRDFGNLTPGFDISSPSTCFIFLPSASFKEGHFYSKVPRTQKYQRSTLALQCSNLARRLCLNYPKLSHDET